MHRSVRSRVAGLLVFASTLALMAGSAIAGPKAYVGNFQDNTVSAIDVAQGKVVATIPVAAGPHGMIFSKDQRALYVAGDASSAVSVIDTTTDTVARTIDVGKTPNGFALLPDGKQLLVAVFDEDHLGIIDTATESVVGTIPVPKPHTIAVAPDGKLAYVTSQEPGHFALAVVDLAARKVVRTVPVDKPPRDAEFASDGKTLYFTKAGLSAVEVLDPASDQIVAEIPTGVSPHYVNLFPGMKEGVVVVQGPGLLEFFDPATDKPSRTVAVGKQPHWAAGSSDGKTVLVTDEGSNEVTTIDVASGKTASIAVGNAPRKIVIQAAAPAQAASADVAIENFAFTPGTITVAQGTTVTWTNKDGPPHAVAFRDGSAGTKLLLPEKTFSRTFDHAGTVDYYCSIHPYMTAQLVVR